MFADMRCFARSMLFKCVRNMGEVNTATVGSTTACWLLGDVNKFVSDSEQYSGKLYFNFF